MVEKDQETSRDNNSQPKPYVPPRLREYGSLVRLVQGGGSGNPGDGAPGFVTKGFPT